MVLDEVRNNNSNIDMLKILIYNDFEVLAMLEELISSIRKCFSKGFWLKKEERFWKKGEEWLISFEARDQYAIYMNYAEQNIAAEDSKSAAPAECHVVRKINRDYLI